MKSRVRNQRNRKSRKQKSRKTGGYRQYLSNIGFSTGYNLGFDRTMNTPSAIRTVSNWVKN